MSQIPPSNYQSVSERDELLGKIRQLEEKCRRAEDALFTLEERDRILGDSAPFGIFVVDTEGRIFGANQKMLDLLAWPADQDITQLNILKHPPLVDSGVADAFSLCMEKKKRLISDHACLIDTDGCAHLRYNISPVIDKDGRFSGIIAFVEDITELKLAEEAIVTSEKRYRLLFESAPVAMVERDAGDLKRHLEQLKADGILDLPRYFDQHPQELVRCLGLIKTVDCNSAFLELMEAQTWDEIEGGLGTTNKPEDIMRMAREIILMVADGNITNEREDTFITLKGTKKSILGKSLPLSGHENTLSRIVIAMVDITKRKQAEEALRISEQLFRNLAMQDNLTGLYNQSLSLSIADRSDRTCENQSVGRLRDIHGSRPFQNRRGHLRSSQWQPHHQRGGPSHTADP